MDDTLIGSGGFVRARGRRWLVEGERDLGGGLSALQVACVDDDAQGETTEIVWQAELDAQMLGDEGWATLARSGTDDPAVFAAYLKTLHWGTATAAERDLFQAPFRAGIRLDAYQLLSGFDNDEGWRGDQIMRVQQAVNRRFGGKIALGIGKNSSLYRSRSRRVRAGSASAAPGPIRQSFRAWHHQCDFTRDLVLRSGQPDDRRACPQPRAGDGHR